MHLSADLYLNSGEKSVPFQVKTFFLVFTKFAYLKKSHGRDSSPPMLKIGKIGVKLQIIPPNAQQRFAPLGGAAPFCPYTCGPAREIQEKLLTHKVHCNNWSKIHFLSRPNSKILGRDRDTGMWWE